MNVKELLTMSTKFGNIRTNYQLNSMLKQRPLAHKFCTIF